MMTFGKGKQFFTLNIIGYEFQNAEEWWDLNWLIVAFTFPIKGRQGKMREPGLTTAELLELRNWLAGNTTSTLSFTEPYLRFRRARMGDRQWLLVRIWLNSEEKVTVRLESNAEQIVEAVAEANKLIEMFPERRAKAL
jgi:hypothetical protein